MRMRFVSRIINEEAQRTEDLLCKVACCRYGLVSIRSASHTLNWRTVINSVRCKAWTLISHLILTDTKDYERIPEWSPYAGGGCLGLHVFSWAISPHHEYREEQHLNLHERDKS